MSAPPTKDFHVAIVGGGICGLAAAAALTKAGVPVQVFEASRRFEEVGAGVGLGPNSIRALDGLGILPAVIARSDQDEPTMRLFSFISGYDPHEVVYDYETTTPEQALGLGIYRPAFLDAVVALVDPSAAHFNKRCSSISVSESGMNIVHFTDGTTHEADMVIGADGIRSVTRDFVVGDPAASPLVFTNTVAYRGLVPTQDLVKAGVRTELTKRPVCFVGLGRHIISFSIKGGDVINFVAFVADHDVDVGPELPLPWVESVSEQEPKDNFQSWGHDPMIILDHLKKPSKWSIHALDPPLQSYVRDRVVLVGDAAHAMLPHLGAGVGQGLEDVLVLTRLLGHPRTNKANLTDALAQYNRVRPPRANAVLQCSAQQGAVYDAYHTSKNDIATTKQLLLGSWDHVWWYDLTKDIATCIEELYPGETSE